MTRLRSFTLTLILQAGIYVLNLHYKWPLLRFSGVGGEAFAGDLVTTLKLADCDGETCSSFIYGEPLAMFIRTISLNQSNIFVLANALILIFLFCVASIASNSNKLSNVVMLNLVCLSPAVALLLERANIDLLMFILVLISGYLLKREKCVWSWFILLLASLIKFYSLAPFVIVSYLFQSHKSKPKRIMIIFISLIIVLFVLLDALTKVSSFPIYWSNSFGAGIWLAWFAAIISQLYQVTIQVSPIQILFASLATTLILMRLASMFLAIRQDWIKLSVKFDLLLLTGLGCFIVGVSFDYRLLFILLPLSTMSLQPKRLFHILILMSAYFSTSNYGLDFRFAYPIIQFLGDFSLYLLIFAVIAAWLPRTFSIQDFRNRIKVL